MNEGKSIFSQLIGFLPDREFRRCVARYGGDRYTKKLSCWEQYLAMAFAQLTYRESLRDIEACLGAIGPKLYHLGIGSTVARSTLADANKNRDWRIFADFAQVLIRTAIKLYANDATGIAEVRDLYALDSTTIDLCLALFPWAKFRKHKAETAYYLLSRVLSPERLNQVVRLHWGIENSLHWRLDVVMNEDQDRTRMGHGPHNLAVLRHMAINAMQKEGSKGSLRGKFKRAGWDDDYLFRLLELF